MSHLDSCDCEVLATSVFFASAYMRADGQSSPSLPDLLTDADHLHSIFILKPSSLRASGEKFLNMFFALIGFEPKTVRLPVWNANQL